MFQWQYAWVLGLSAQRFKVLHHRRVGKKWPGNAAPMCKRLVLAGLDADIGDFGDHGVVLSLAFRVQHAAAAAYVVGVGLDDSDHDLVAGDVEAQWFVGQCGERQHCIGFF